MINIRVTYILLHNNCGIIDYTIMESKCEEVSGIESLRHEFQAFKSFFVEQVHLIKHRKAFENYGNDDNDTRYINTLINQIIFLKEENQTKNIMIQSLLDRCSINFGNNDKMKFENNEFDNNKCNSNEKSNPNNVNHKYSLYDKNRDNNCRCNDDSNRNCTHNYGERRRVFYGSKEEPKTAF